MITFARTLVATAVLSAVLTGCGDELADSTDPGRDITAPAPAPSVIGTVGTQKAPALARGPGGLTPVLDRGTPGARKVVALTFDAIMAADQGPRAALGERFDNPELIALLRRLEVPATIFMTGRWAEQYPAQARAIGTDPLFEIANHSYSHYAFTADCPGLPRLGTGRMRADVERAFTAFHRTGARRIVPYFRFPGGCYDKKALRALAPSGVTAVQWDVAAADATSGDSGPVADAVVSGVRPGSVVAMHCTNSAAPVTEAAVERIVPELRDRGYRFVKVSELMRR